MAKLFELWQIDAVQVISEDFELRLFDRNSAAPIINIIKIAADLKREMWELVSEAR